MAQSPDPDETRSIDRFFSQLEEAETANTSEPDILNSTSSTCYEFGHPAIPFSNLVPSSPPQPPQRYSDCDLTDEDDDLNDELRRESTITANTFQKRAKRSVSDAIASVFDKNCNRNLNFSYHNLESIPPEVEDLGNHEDLETTKFNLDFRNNLITEVPFFIYNIQKLQYLSLGCNEISYLSPLIKHLVNLKELNIGQNRLKALPIEINSLPKLENLISYPNPFERNESNAPQITRMYSTEPLAEMCIREIMRSSEGSSYKDFKALLDHLGPMYSSIAFKGLQSIRLSMVCTQCNALFSKPYIRVVEWKFFKNNSSGDKIPFESNFCSVRCWNNSQFAHACGFISTPA